MSFKRPSGRDCDRRLSRNGRVSFWNFLYQSTSKGRMLPVYFMAWLLSEEHKCHSAPWSRGAWELEADLAGDLQPRWPGTAVPLGGCAAPAPAQLLASAVLSQK